MGVADLLSPQRIELNLPLQDKQAVLERLVKLEGYGEAILDLEAFRRDMMAREAQGGTAVEAGVAVPHAKSAAVRYPSLAVVTLREGIDCGALDGVPSDIFFMIAAPADAELHMAVLARLTRLLLEPEFLEQLRQAITPEEFLEIVDEFEQRLPQLDSRWQEAPTAKVLAVTACPTGIAHTYMAADALERAGQRLGISVKVETQGAGGTKNKLTSQEIRQCTAVVIAAGREVDMSRFQGIKVLRVSVNEGIYRAEELVPYLSCPQGVDNVHSIEEVQGTPLNEVYIGSCTNGSLENMAVAARILQGHHVAPYLKLIIIPASIGIYRQCMRLGYIRAFVEAGAMVAHPCCGLCCGQPYGLMSDGEVILGTNNRNFIGRMGTTKSLIYLSSPATAAASAITGVITDPRTVTAD